MIESVRLKDVLSDELISNLDLQWSLQIHLQSYVVILSLLSLKCGQEEKSDGLGEYLRVLLSYHHIVCFLNLLNHHLELLWQLTQGLNKDTNDSRVSDSVEGVDHEGEYHLLWCSCHHINQSKSNGWVVEARKILEVKQFLGLNIRIKRLRNRSTLVHPEVEKADFDRWYPDRILLHHPPDKAGEDVGVNDNDEEPVSNNGLGFVCLRYIWISDFLFNLFDSESFQ